MIVDSYKALHLYQLGSIDIPLFETMIFKIIHIHIILVVQCKDGGWPRSCEVGKSIGSEPKTTKGKGSGCHVRAQSEELRPSAARQARQK